MKYARKMILVDASTVNPPVNDKNSCDLARAINSLVSNSEFSRDYFGSSALTVADLNKTLAHLLERRDIDPSDKLKFYTQTLNRYLFLQRMSENPVVQPPPPALPLPAPVPVPEPQKKPEILTESSGSDSDTFSSIHGESSRDRTILTPKTPIRPPNQPIHSSTPKSRTYYNTNRPHQSNLPRATPKKQTLRPTAAKPPSKYADFFTNWKPESHKPN